jgi:hypothetical protein
MLFVEYFASLLRVSRHLHSVDFKSSFADIINNFTHVHVSIRLDSSESSLPLVFEMVSSVHITVVHNL